MNSIISIIDVAGRCGVRINGNLNRLEVRAQCPFCHDKRSMNLNTVKNVYYCHHCKERGNSISLYSKLMGVPDAKAAYRELAA